ncbi:MAG: sulfite exporter TauE/SafE family protein [Lachnospiraceae bacterium]|nr:sulfite exporter TauE/SafE family protein [Lachnospiraceae bacterium]
MQGERTEIIKVKGMFCTNCESRIQKTLGNINGVTSAVADYQKEEVKVTYIDDKVTIEDLKKEIVKLGYETASDSDRYIQVVSILIILLAAYVIANHLGLTKVFNIFPSIETTINMGMLFVIGILTSVHCIAMCGGINLTQSTMTAKSDGRLIGNNLSYNVGRVISYTILGGIAGGIGSIISFGGVMRGSVAVLAGIIMLIMAFNMLGIFKRLRKFNVHMPKGFYLGLSKLLKGRSSFVIGLLNGLMPCGPLQSMQIYALSTESIVKGMLSMLLFGMGTVPLMFGFGLFSGRLNKKYAKYMLTVSAFLIFIMGLHMIGKGLALSGVSLPSGDTSNENAAQVIGDSQIVKTEIDYGSYESITVKKNIPVVWTVVVPEGKLNGCNGEIIIPEYDVDIKLSEGENIISFTPDKTGTIPYSCWMGMIKSNIVVVE